jgi:hypothetical protein
MCPPCQQLFFFSVPDDSEGKIKLLGMKAGEGEEDYVVSLLCTRCPRKILSLLSSLR